MSLIIIMNYDFEMVFEAPFACECLLARYQ